MRDQPVGQKNLADEVLSSLLTIRIFNQAFVQNIHMQRHKEDRDENYMPSLSCMKNRCQRSDLILHFMQYKPRKGSETQKNKPHKAGRGVQGNAESLRNDLIDLEASGGVIAKILNLIQEEDDQQSF
ncbi:hypothetical protein Tco_0005558 [Tanacetum coccineum]